MELFVRLAISKYYKTKQVGSQSEAIKRLFEKELLQYLRGFECHTWRASTFWCENCDTILKAYMPVLKMLFQKNSGKYTKPGMPLFMSLEEFSELISATGVCTDNFG